MTPPSQDSTPNQSLANALPPKPVPPKKSRRKRNIVVGISLGLALVILIVLALFVPMFVKVAESDAFIKIPANASRQNVRDSVALYLGDSYAEFVMMAATLLRSDFSNRHGGYLIKEGMNPFSAARQLARGGQEPLTVTLKAIRTLPNLAKRVAGKLDFTPDSLLNVIKDPATLEEYGLTPEQAIALFVDDSYDFYWSASPEEFVDKIGDNYNNVWNHDRKVKAAILGLSPAEVMTLCSIVDEETNKVDEKGKIGRLYLNRIKKGIPLQADPTVKYALQDFSLRRIRGNHLKADSPYNTYRNKGLPPGPIRTTSVTTIDEVLNSQPSEDIYMCAKEDFSGYHNFASTYSEHQANARRYQQALNKRGIR